MLCIYKIPDLDVYLVIELSYDGTTWSYFYASALESVGTIIQLDVADFGPFYVLAFMALNNSNETVVSTYYRDVEANTQLFCLVQQTDPTFGTVCNFNGQLVGGYMASEELWPELGTNAVAWSAIGSFQFDPAQDIVAGSATLFLNNVSQSAAIIYKVLPLENCVAVYSDAGKLLLRPNVVGNSFTYGSQPLSGFGVSSGNHVAGDKSIHGFVDIRNDFWTLTSSGELTLRGYREWLDDIMSVDTIVSYAPKNKSFYISNGVECLIINEFGAHKAHQLPSSVFQGFDGYLYGTLDDNEDEEARIVTDNLDFGSRGIKSVESLLVGISQSEGIADMAVDWRVHKSAVFQRSSYVTGGPTAEAAIHVAALDFRLVLKADTYVGTYVHYLMPNIKYSDQRFKRGTIPAQYQVGEA